MRSLRDLTLRPRRWPGALALVLALPLAGCAGDSERPDPAPSASAPSRAGATAGAAPDVRARLRVDGVTREYLLHRPADGAGGGPRPLVIAFHGRGADAAELREKSRLERAAGARGMLVAYPEGLDEGWGAGTRATERRPDPDLDVRFTEALIEHLVRAERADPERVYATGFSNGGSMALRVAAQRPGLLAGAASVSGQLPAGAAGIEPTGPVPVMVVYGADDPVRPLAGWPSPPPDPEEPILPSLSARDSAEAFATAGGAGAPVTEERKGYDRTVWRLGAAPRSAHGAAATVQLLVVHDAGHTWPGSDVTPPKGFGPTSRALDATDTILDFFTDEP
ncbi:Secreted protein [Streptomyces ambofaciens ATCC 23877]|uniref:Secreted protein n=1 Tax=Streptomyces ambofaciens (strain ATCC 23877 / 3486 / DSM 40053 / JCM 4204 / NBRC 12836 / NRRL B-2516) TaxID=278992 RepID=A0A0K2AVT0_STRA7|nr:PHB depolymerase family esterase [Streptomyces ambofaciens]AKZ56932.1 Secreted protein [Streptomyces ambofaciens ATCC 23877]